MATDKPSERYFQPKHGEWRGDYRFAVSSYGALLTSSMQWMGKLAAISMSLACRLFGALRIETEVDTTNLPQRDVLHKTRISKWGVTLFQSEEHFLFDEDNQRMK